MLTISQQNVIRLCMDTRYGKPLRRLYFFFSRHFYLNSLPPVIPLRTVAFEQLCVGGGALRMMLVAVPERASFGTVFISSAPLHVAGSAETPSFRVGFVLEKRVNGHTDRNRVNWAVTASESLFRHKPVSLVGQGDRGEGRCPFKCSRCTARR